MQMRSFLVAASVSLAALAGCGGGDTASNVKAPGATESPKTKMLEAGAAALQNKPPVEAINSYLDGFHFYSGNMKAQMEAHHYCSILNDEVIQCAIYDGNTAKSKLMGVEYIVSERLYKTLPAEEKRLWHSHVHEVKSGQLVAPGIPEMAEHELMKKLVSTYGKTWHTWHTDQHKELPVGVPQLMMGPIADGQIDPAMVAERDRRMNVNSDEKRRNRADIPAPLVDPDADAWQRGGAFQIDDPTGMLHATPSTASPGASRTPDGPGTSATSGTDRAPGVPRTTHAPAPAGASAASAASPPSR